MFPILENGNSYATSYSGLKPSYCIYTPTFQVHQQSLPALLSPTWPLCATHPISTEIHIPIIPCLDYYNSHLADLPASALSLLKTLLMQQP